MGPDPPSLEVVVAYVRRRQRATLASLAAVVPVAALVAVLAIAAAMVNGSGVGLLAMLWPMVIIARIAANVVEERRALATAERLLARPDVALSVRRHEVWVDAGDRRVRLPLVHSAALRPPRAALPPARAVPARRGR